MLHISGSTSSTTAALIKVSAADLSKRAIMNSLYLAAVKLRKAQKKYFKTRAQTDLTACRVLESDFDELLDEIRLNASGHLTKQPIQPPLPNM